MTTELYFTNSMSSCDHSWKVFHIQDINKEDENEIDIFSDKNGIAEKTDE